MQVNNQELNLKHVIKRLSTTKDGEDLLLGLETMYNAKSSFVAGDSHATAFNEGQRSVVLFMLSCLTQDEVEK